MSRLEELHSMFYPRSVAVVGVSTSPVGWGGYGFIKRLKRAGFQGNVYAVNPKASSDVMGVKAYPSVSAIPEPPDLVIVSVPAPLVPGVLEDCIAAGVKNVHIFSSGFAETQEEEGRRLEEQIAEIIRRGKLQVLGPNCMGPYVPASKLAAWGARPQGTGHLAFISQSGGHADRITRFAQDLGVYFSKVISLGNARGLQILDLLEYLAEDDDTKIVAIYVEGIEDGNRFVRLVQEVNRTKPVMVWKGGVTESGARAVASHTGSMAGETRVWDAFFAQTGAIRVNSVDDIIDVAMLFLHLPPLRGRRALLLGGGGGNAVAMTDICSQNGLSVPPLAESTRKRLAEFISLAGNSVMNPLDVWLMQENVELFERCVEIAAGDPATDFIIADYRLGGIDEDMDYSKPQRLLMEFIIDFARNNPFKKPVVVTVSVWNRNPENAKFAYEARVKFARAGVPAYPSQMSATRALSRFIGYYEFQARCAGLESDITRDI